MRNLNESPKSLEKKCTSNSESMWEWFSRSCLPHSARKSEKKKSLSPVFLKVNRILGPLLLGMAPSPPTQLGDFKREHLCLTYALLSICPSENPKCTLATRNTRWHFLPQQFPLV